MKRSSSRVSKEKSLKPPPYSALTWVEENHSMRKLYKLSDDKWLDGDNNEWKLEGNWWFKKNEGQWVQICQKEYAVKIMR